MSFLTIRSELPWFTCTTDLSRFNLSACTRSLNLMMLLVLHSLLACLQNSVRFLNNYLQAMVRTLDLNFLWDLLTRLRKLRIKLQHRLPGTEKVPFKFHQNLENLFCCNSSDVLLGMQKWILWLLLSWTKSAKLQCNHICLVQG